MHFLFCKKHHPFVLGSASSSSLKCKKKKKKHPKVQGKTTREKKRKHHVNLDRLRPLMDNVSQLIGVFLSRLTCPHARLKGHAKMDK